MPYDMKGKAQDRSSTSMTSATNSGPGQGKYKAKTGSPIDLGLSSQSFLPGGTAGKLRQDTNEAEQRPVSSKDKIKVDRGSFDYIVD